MENLKYNWGGEGFVKMTIAPWTTYRRQGLHEATVNPLGGSL